MDTKDLVNIKKQRIREELEKLVPPGFFLQPHPKVRKSEIYDQLDEFLGIDETLSRQVGYLNATDKEYNTAIQHLRFFGLKLKDYKDVVNTGPFYNAPELNKNLKEACDYMIRFYELAQITINRINNEEDVRLKLLQNQIEKEKQQQKQSQIEDKKAKAKSFVSSATSFRPGTKVNVRVTRSAGIIPKRAIPQQALDVISKKTDVESDEAQISGSRKLITDLGRVTLQIEQTNNNLNRVVEIIAEDIANTKEQNRKEVDEYRKRTQDRSRKLGVRELGSSKVDVAGVVKKYVGSFFSGTGGALRALASYNLIEKLLSGDFLGAVGPLLAIGTTYLPQIGALVAGLIGKKILKGLFSGGGKTATRASRAVTGAPKLSTFGKLGKFGKYGLLAAGGLALGSAVMGSRDDEEEQTDQQQRLEQLTQEQKGLVQQEDIKPTAIPQNDLMRFQSLNEKFEKTLDFLLKKQKEDEMKKQTEPGGRGGGTPTSDTTQTPPAEPLTGNVPQQNVVPTGQTIDASGGISYYGPGFEGNRTASGTTFNKEEMTAAHKTLPFGTLLKVTNKDNGKSVVVRVTDRGPFFGDRVLDLSEGAMRQLGGIGTGVLKNATIEVVKEAPKPTPLPSPSPTPTPTPTSREPVRPKEQNNPEVSKLPKRTPSTINLPFNLQTPDTGSIASAAGETSNIISVSTDQTSACGFMAKLNMLTCQLVDVE